MANIAGGSYRIKGLPTEAWAALWSGAAEARMKLALPGLLAAIAMAAALGSCGSESADNPAHEPAPAAMSELPGGMGLPAPSTLLPKLGGPKVGSFVEADLAQAGSAFRADLPNNKVQIQANSLEMSPDFASSASSFNGLSYSMFGFPDLTDYDRDEAVNTKWGQAPADGTCWIGLANWDKDRWDWFPLGQDLRAAVSPSSGGPLKNYMNLFGGLLLVVVMTGTDSAKLDSLRIGSYPPNAIITANPQEGLAPLNTTLDASLSSDSDGSIAKYEWDLDGDGIYETDGGTSDSIQHSFPSPGDFSVGLRVTDNNNAADTSSTFVSVNSEWDHTWGKAADDNMSALAVGDNRIYAAGYLDFDSDADIVLQSYSMDGSRIWTKTWDSGDMDIVKSIARSDDGNSIYLTGYTAHSGVLDILLQAWDSNGNIKWTRTWGGPATDYGNEIVLADGAVFVCGSSSSLTDPQAPQAVILRFSESGNLEWQRSWGGAEWDECHSACLIPSLFGDSSIGLIGDTNSYGAGQMDILYLRFSLDGNLSTALSWGDAGVQTATGLVSSVFSGTYAGGWEGSPVTGGLALRVTNGKPSFAMHYDGGVSMLFQGLAFDNGDLIPVGYINLGADLDLLSGRIDPETGVFNLIHMAKAGGAQSGECVKRLPDGSFVFTGKSENSVNISWAQQGATSTDRGSIAWQSINKAADTPSIQPNSLSILPTFGSGTSDTGGGIGDFFIGAHKL